MKRTMLVMAMVMALALSTMAGAFADGHLPSTNEDNQTNGWAHFNVLETRVGEVDVEFVSTRNFWSCFEYRSDGEATTDPRDNFNPDVTDGLWPYTCINSSTTPMTLAADEYVEIRMVFGAEEDERFDWTRVDVLAAPTVDDCRDGGFADLGFRNQGQCIASFKANANAGK